MLGIDTNVVIRLIISDDAEQTRRARKLVEQTLSHDEPVLVSLLVLLESEWVLRSRYGFNREALLSIFRALLEARELSFEDEPALEEALFRWKDSACGFRIASSLPTIDRWDAALRLPSMAKRLGCLVRYRSSSRVMRLPKVDLSPVRQFQNRQRREEADQRPTTKGLEQGTSHRDVSLRCRTWPHIPRKFTR